MDNHNNSNSDKVLFPESILIEPTCRCNLRCPVCFTGRNDTPPTADMPLSLFKKIIDEIAGKCREIGLYNFGESFLHKDIFAMIEYAKANGLYIYVSSNLNLPKFYMERMVLSGLDELTVSVDAASEESYKKFRVGGDYNLLIDNIREIVKFKKTHNVLTPKIELQFIIMSHNEDEVEPFQELAKELGVDSVHFKTLNLRGYEDLKSFLPSDRYSRYAEDVKPVNKCDWPFKSLVINCDGNVKTCCYLGHKDIYTMGNVNNESIDDIWQGKKYSDFRKQMLNNKSEMPVCCDCVSTWNGAINDQIKKINKQFDPFE